LNHHLFRFVMRYDSCLAHMSLRGSWTQLPTHSRIVGSTASTNARDHSFWVFSMVVDQLPNFLRANTPVSPGSLGADLPGNSRDVEQAPQRVTILQRRPSTLRLRRPSSHRWNTPVSHRGSIALARSSCNPKKTWLSHMCRRSTVVRMPVVNLNGVARPASSCFTPVPPFVTPAVRTSCALCPRATGPISPPQSLDTSPTCHTPIRSSTRRAKTSAAASPHNDATDKQHRSHR
jgi:hypothetical protein